MDKAVKEALEPFAKAVGLYDERWPDERRLLPSNPDGSTVTLGDLRRARAALAHLNDSPAETLPGPSVTEEQVARIIEEDVCCDRPCGGCENHCYPEFCPAKKAAARIFALLQGRKTA